MTGAEVSPGEAQAPGLRRRMACFLYEGLLLFGVLMPAGLVYSVLTRQEHALVGLHGLQVVVFVVLGAYFVGFWSRSGQTLAMQTWRLRLVTRSGQPVPKLQALVRYFLSWLWFMPALFTAGLIGLKSSGPVFGMLLAGVLAYAALSWLHPQRQFWHDAVCGTRLITWQAPPRA